jgi:hypothetical protein
MRWVAETADHILAVMEESRSTWQMWRVLAEAQRQVRTADVYVERASALVDLLVVGVLDCRSVALAAPRDGIDEPLRWDVRTDCRSIPSPVPPSIPRGGSLMPTPASSPRPDSAAV